MGFSSSLRAVLPGYASQVTLPAAPALPKCANQFCPRPPSLWQRWWARNEGAWFHQEWYCSPGCLQDGLLLQLEGLLAAPPRRSAQPNRMPLGLVLLSQNAITGEQLRQALAMQQSTKSGRLGHWLVRMGAVTEEQVTSALGVQQGCPVFSALAPPTLAGEMHWPRPLIEVFRALPAFYSAAQSTLYVGFLETVDHAFLYAVEQVLGCRTQSCILPPKEFQRGLEWEPLEPQSETITIEQGQTSYEMAQAVASYAQQAHAARCAMACCGGYLWFRLNSAGASHVDLLFRPPVKRPPSASSPERG